MLRELSVDGLDWDKNTFKFDKDFTEIYSKDEKYVLEVDVQNLEKLHDLHNYLLFVFKIMKIKKLEKPFAKTITDMDTEQQKKAKSSFEKKLF